MPLGIVQALGPAPVVILVEKDIAVQILLTVLALHLDQRVLLVALFATTMANAKAILQTTVPLINTPDAISGQMVRFIAQSLPHQV